MPQIILNQIRTPDGTILKSFHRQHYVQHLDKNGKMYMVDGGNDYLRRNRHDDAPYDELTVYSDADFKIIRESLHRGGRGKDGTSPLTWVPLNKMSDSWLDAAIEYNSNHGLENTYVTQFYKKEQEYRKDNNIKINE